MKTTVTNGQATVTAIKTKYSSRLERVYNRLNKHWFKKAAVRYKQALPYDSHPTVILNVYGKRETFKVCTIGCNSFGMEVFIKDKYNIGQWTAIEQLTASQQAKVISAIDWDTAD